MYVTNAKEDPQENHFWRLNFDGAPNALGNGIGAVLVSPNGDYHPFTSKLDFDCTSNMAEYEACIMGIRAAIERKIKTLEVYGDSALVIYQLRGEWKIRDPKLIRYRRLVLELIEEFDNITFCYLPWEENQMADALATLASMIKDLSPDLGIRGSRRLKGNFSPFLAAVDGGAGAGDRRPARWPVTSR
ncbi:uncharacterized protein [Gossypium hirsutum]|uniref:RNase H type-1 domain-containing protein n=1 Tax=Gossypium hirsutum TaxID=3635 RepID=A0ABM2ZXL9_GOSHI|nr:uncharacterized protein LOC121216133 [Gossypium hirsutum]